MKGSIRLLALALLLWCPNAAAAGESPVNASLGIKSWFNTWRHRVDYADGTSQSWNNGSALMAGPSLNIRIGALFLGASYLRSVDDYEASDWDTPGDRMKFGRKDSDAALGYMFTPAFGLSLNYKILDAPMTYTAVGGLPDPLGDRTWKLKGPGIGMLAKARIGRSAAFYASLSASDMEQEFESRTGRAESFDVIGASAEIGGAFAFSRSLWSTIGFNYQSFRGDTPDLDTHRHTFYGVTLGLSYTI
jgi:hypothetical protein